MTAASALQNWGTSESIPALQKALEDSDRSVRSRAKKAIDVISSQK
jgi:HEAT repeat protein